MASRIFLRTRIPTARQALLPKSLSRSYASSTPPSPPRASRFRKFLLYTTGATLSGVAFTYWDDAYNDMTVTRNFRTAWNGLALAVDYKLNFDPESLDSINALHERSAARLLNVCEKNRGLYVKLAQAMATQGPFLPKPYAKLAKLLDDAEQFPYEIVRETIERELGAPLEEFFIRFDPVPIAAASIAQVHRARIRLPNGEEEEVAVKVQRPDIRRHAKWDLWAYRTLLGVYEYFFDLPLSFAAGYITDQLMRETQFDNEASNSERIRAHVLNSASPLIRSSVYVPRIHPSLSTPRLLTMEYIEGASKLTDLEAIREKGLGVKAVARSVAEVFAAQIFEYGFVQADGHPSNVLVRKHPNGKRGEHQIVLIDHGLYIPLTPTFREKYSQLWYAIVVQDLPSVYRICEGWGIGQAELFASATLLKPWNARGSAPAAANGGGGVNENDELAHASHDSWKKNAITMQGSGEGVESDVVLTPAEKKKRDDKRALDAQNEIKEKLKTFLTNVELLPKELVFIGRAMRILQANNQAMGSPVNRINILAKHASLGLLHHNNPSLADTDSSTPGRLDGLPAARFDLRDYVSTRLTFLRFRTTLFVIDIAFYLTNLYAWSSDLQRRISTRIWGASKDGANGGKNRFEDRLESNLRDIARSKFGMQIEDDAFEG